MTRVALVRLVATAGLALLVSAAPASGHGRDRPPFNPVIFVHGGFGSGAQFESQKMRFTSNGYPRSYVRVVDYDSTFATNTRADVYARIDARVAELQRQTGKAKVDILGHSLGTTLMHEYLTTSAARAANVGHYVNIDGRTAAAPPGGVPTLAIWAGRGSPGRSIGGALNVTVPNQTHVESATSRESFGAMFEFFTGHKPRTLDIVPEHGRVRVAGRAVQFPSNLGAGNLTIEVWRVHGSTGQRVGGRPRYVLTPDSDGGWGPVWLRPGRHYEFALVRPGARIHHFYYEPFVRSDDLVRLLTSNPGEGLDVLIEKSDRHASLVITRNKELWGDQGAESDVLTVNGANLLNPATAPITKRLIGLFAFDAGSDGVSNLAGPLPALAGLPFISGVDDYIPAEADAAGKVALSLTSRGTGPRRTVNAPNFPSTKGQVSIQLNDFERVCWRCVRRSHRRSGRGRRGHRGHGHHKGQLVRH